MKYRIIITVKELNKNNWGLIYCFIKGFYENALNETTFKELLKIVQENGQETTIKLSRNFLNRNVYSSYGDDLVLNKLPEPHETTFSILYQKQDESRDFSNLVQFYFLHKHFEGKVTLGINLDCFIDIETQNDFTFPCRSFLDIFKNEKPIHGENTVYFINEKNIDKSTGEINIFRTSTATFRNQIEEKNISRYILPLTIINIELFYPLFKSVEYENEKIKDFVIAIDKQDETINDNRIFARNEKNKSQQFRSIFEEWFIKAYFTSLKKPTAKKIKFNDTKNRDNYIDNDNLIGLISLLKSYCENIKELVENIIFHTNDKQGLIYVVFQKKENLTNSQNNNLVEINSYKDFDRFVEIGIMDFNEKGIIDKYNETSKNDDKANTKLIDFFITKNIHTTGLDHLYLRYIAHLGIKTFANSVINYNGSFYVESNTKGTKEAIEYNKGELSEKSKKIPYFYDGTHYEIVFPVKKENNYRYINNKSIIQYNSISNYLKKYLTTELPSYTNINFNQLLKFIDNGLIVSNISSKEEQKILIERIGTLVIEKYGPLDGEKNIVLNIQRPNKIDLCPLFETFLNDVSLFFKLLSFIQLQNKTFFKRIVLTNLSNKFLNDFCDIIKNLLINSNAQVVWSNDTAIILISDNLRYQIICGETKNEIAYINDKLNSYYLNKNSFDFPYDTEQIPTTNIEKLDDFVLPYEFLIKTIDGVYFNQYVSDIIENPIEAENIGCKVSHKNSRIGSKIIIENYYEADFLFQNSFFVERFAYFIAKEIINLDYNNKKSNDKIALIGYNPYSELLIKKIQFYVNSYYKDKISTVIIAKEEDNELLFKFDAIHKKDFVKKPNFEILHLYKYITIVPIASTLTTNDKIIALFRQQTGLQNIEFIYNHCTILVRDKIEDEPTDTERKQKWTKKTGNIIETNYDNAKKINFLIEKEGIWHSLINSTVSFPTKYWKEVPVNQTQNASLNSQNLFSYPNVAIPKEDKDQNSFFQLSQERLKEVKDYIYFGHIECNKNHHRYYIDTEEYIRSSEKTLFEEWIKQLKDKSVFKERTSNILITPDTNFESDFINIINNELFNDSALVLYVDIDKWRNNIKDKFSFLQAINGNSNKPNFHFIDHALLTASSYKKAKSYILSILNDGQNEEKTFNFRSIITLINRLSHDRNKEISESEKVPVYSFTHLFIPPSKDPEKDCSLCELGKHYDKLKERSVLDGCRTVIERNKLKIAPQPFNKYTNNNENLPKIELEKINQKSRHFIRLEMQHRLFFEISNIVKNFDGIIRSEANIKSINQKVLRKLTELYNEYNCNIDSKISFFKNISSPPLSHYIKMRYYAHRKLLVELHKTLTKEEPNYDDLCVLKVILKQLSMLGSNSLVRREVILGSWELYFKVKEQLPQETKINEKILNDFNERKKQIKEEILVLLASLEDKKSIAPEDLNESRKQNEEIFILQKEIDILEKEKLLIEKEIIEHLSKSNKINHINDFNSDFQFFVKNAIFDDEAKSLWLGELLRTGNEIKKEDIVNNNVNISETVLENSIFTFIKEKKRKLEEKEEFLRFLLWTFYDNTTIIRKTLENFEKELDKNEDLKIFFSSNGNLIDFEDLSSNIESIRLLYKSIIEKQYYYSNIGKYISQVKYSSSFGNPDGVNFVEKLIYVLYAKLKLQKINGDIKKNSNKDRLEDIAKSLLQIFSKIMGADAAFFSMKHKNGGTNTSTIHTLSVNNITISINYFEKFYTSDVLSEKEKYKHIMFPLLIKESLDESYQEKKLLKYECLVCFVLNNPQSQVLECGTINETKVIGSITFLYKEADNKFKIRSQEYGRLLLLLKPEFDEYIRHILSEKTVDLWVEKNETHKLNKDFIARYRKNSHGAKKYLDEISSHLFDKNLGGNPSLYAVAADLFVGEIHYSLLTKQEKRFGANYFSIEDKIPKELLLCARKHLLNACFKKKNIKISLSDFKGKKIYYSEETPFLLFQLINNIIAHTKINQENAQIEIFIENENIIFKNSHSDITQDKINNIRQLLYNKETIPRKSISLYCINHYIQNMCNNCRGERKITELSIDIEDNNTFIVKIPILKL